MKVLVFSASTGGGHMSAANSIKEYFSLKGISVKVVDAIEYISPILNKSVTEIYEYIALKQPKIWKVMYDTANKRSVNKLLAGVNSLIGKKLMPLFDEIKPDIVISTHPFTTEMISDLKVNNYINLPLICVMTDYAPHRTWISEGVDGYVVANSDMIQTMQEMGVDPKKIHPYGIPVDDSFYSKTNRSEVLRELSLDENLPTILIMAGKGGLANIDKLYRKLQTIDIDFQIIIITGKNQKLYHKITNISKGKSRFKMKFRPLSPISKYFPKLKHRKFKFKRFGLDKIKKTKVIYFTKEVEKYMSASDLIITKPGGLTVSEALACKLPMALFSAIPGQEEENANFLVSNNMAVKLEKDPAKTIKNLLEHPLKLSFMKSSCEKFDKSDSLKNILALVKELTVQEKVFNKLVRDKIPQIISDKGDTPVFDILSDEEYVYHLTSKLIEEAYEVKEADSFQNRLEELADVLEVLCAIANTMNVSLEDIHKCGQNKNEKRGTFNSKIFLKKVLLTKDLDK